MEKGTIKVKFSNGFGNNLFQYCFGRLLAEYHNLNYCHDAIPELGVRKEIYPFNKKLKIIKFRAKTNLEAKKYDKNHQKYFQSMKESCNFDFYTFIFYFEDYTLYKPYLDKIRSWFPDIKKTNTKDLVLHLRLRNRVVWATHYKNFVKPQIYKEIIKTNFKFEKLFIVTDSEKWDYVTKKDIRKVQQEIAKKYKRNPTKFISVDKSVKYVNSLIDSLKDFEPILHHSKRAIDDFNFIRSFDQIIFKNSTFAWWASVLSKASKIGVFKLWKPGKGKDKNRNLGQANFPGWFSWGEIGDLLHKPEGY